jgi:glutaredoxin
MKTTILKFYSDTCMPCKLLSNVLKEAQIEHQSIDVMDGKNTQLIMDYNIRNIPVLIKVDYQGHEISRLNGFPGTKAVEEFCNE